MIRLLLICLLFVLTGKANAQNLLANGDFEDRNTCIEYHVYCAAEGWFRIPLSPVSPYNGTAGFLSNNHYENILTENTTNRGILRSYLYTRLLCKLEKGRVYTFTASFRSESGPFDHVDLQFLDFEPFRYQTKILKPETAPVTITPKHFIEEKRKGFAEYAISFTATGNEQYLLIGNLLDSKLKRRRGMVIYNIDNASLRPEGKQEKACPEKNSNQKRLYANDFRHTPNMFIDEDEKQIPSNPPVVISKEPVVPSADTPVTVQVIAPPVNDTLVIPDVLFKFDKSELNPVFSIRIDTLIDKIRYRTFKRIEILGHTDSLGTNEYNERLSHNRSETVKKYIAKRLNYPEDKIVTKAFAATLPVSTNRTSAGRQKNRRVEIVLVR